MGRAGGKVIPRGTGAPKPCSGRVIEDGTRGTDGPGRPPKVDSAVPGWLPIAPPPAPGVGPSLVLDGTAPAAVPGSDGISWAKARLALKTRARANARLAGGRWPFI